MQRLALLGLAAVLVAGWGGASQALAACPPTLSWAQHAYDLTRTVRAPTNSSTPIPKHVVVGRVIARTKRLSFTCVAFPTWRPRKVAVYSLPGISPSVAIRVEGPTFSWAIYMRRGWQVMPGTPLWRLTHFR